MKYRVLIDVDENGGDDDVFVVSVTVEADTEQDAITKAEAMASARYGKDNVLGAFESKVVA